MLLQSSLSDNIATITSGENSWRGASLPVSSDKEKNTKYKKNDKVIKYSHPKIVGVAVTPMGEVLRESS